MDYHTPGVYIREVDSGAKPIASVATSIPGFLGMFNYTPTVDAIAITGSDGTKAITGKVSSDLLDDSGGIATKEVGEAVTALTQAFSFKKGSVKNLKKLLDLNGHKANIWRGLSW